MAGFGVGGFALVAPAASTGQEPPADVRFVRAMIPHHAQALLLTGLVPDRGADPRVATFARRIEAAQGVEINRMHRWLERQGDGAHSADHSPVDTGVALPSPAGGHGPDEGMHGMLSDAEIRELESLRGAAFDRRFLELMIRHHEGAVRMAAQLFGTPGGAQDPEIFDLAAEIDGSQRVEIERMRGLLSLLP